MPELPEVETVRRGLEPAMAGARILSVEQRRSNLRFPFPPDFAARLAGRTIKRIGRRAKFLVVELDDGMALLMHLGMSGSFRLEEAGYGMPHPFHHPRGKAGAHDHVVFHLSSGARVTYNDPRRFGAMDLVPLTGLEESRHLKGLGVEPLGNEFNGPVLASLLAGKKAPLKAALLDQRLIAGLGNIYVCEALWRARLSPLKPAGSIVRANGKPKVRAERLAADIRTVLEEAVAAGGSSLRDHARTDGTLGDFQHHFAVYDREGEPCLHPHCRGIIRRIVQAGRSTFYCPVSQK